MTIKNPNMPTAFHRLITDVLRQIACPVDFSCFGRACETGSVVARNTDIGRQTILVSGVFPGASVFLRVHRCGGLGNNPFGYRLPRCAGRGLGGHQQAGAGDDLVGGLIGQY